jgi:hypothetical protein
MKQTRLMNVFFYFSYLILDGLWENHKYIHLYMKTFDE